MRVAMQWSCLVACWPWSGRGSVLGTIFPGPRGRPSFPRMPNSNTCGLARSPSRGGLSEGPTVARDGSIYFSDIPMGPDAGKIMRFDPKSKSVSVFAEDSRKSNGLKIDPNGYLVACEGRTTAAAASAAGTSPPSKHTIVVDVIREAVQRSERPLRRLERAHLLQRPQIRRQGTARNSMCAPFTGSNIDGTVVEATRNVEKPNGLVLSPDEKTLFVADNNNNSDDVTSGEKSKPGAMKIYSFALDEKGLPKGERKNDLRFRRRAGL